MALQFVRTAHLTSTLLVTGLLTACGTTISPQPPQEPRLAYRSKVTPYPGTLPAEAPQNSKFRCESLPSQAIKPKATTQDLLLEIQRTRSKYAECANRHNVLVDFQAKQEKAIKEIVNHYQQQ